MSTKRKIQTNRINGQQSHGPASPEGKAISSQNALKHGLDAKTLVLKHEQQSDLDLLTAEYFDSCKPTTPKQRYLVETLINCDWLRRRYLRTETELWNRNIDDTEFVDSDSKKPQKWPLGRAFGWKSDQLVRVDHRLYSAHRTYTSAVKQLQVLQAADTTAPAPDSTPVQGPADPTPSPEPATEPPPTQTIETP